MIFTHAFLNNLPFHNITVRRICIKHKTDKFGKGKDSCEPKLEPI